MNNKRLSLITLLLLVFASGLLAGCNKETPAEHKNQSPEQQKLRREKEGD
jgi:hypothetical protein